MLLLYKLQTRINQMRQRVLTVGRGDKAYFSSNNVELLLRASARCFAPSASMSLEDKLRTRSERTRQGVLTVKTRSEAAYLTLVSVLLTLSASAMYIPSSGPTNFSAKLQTRIDQTRQGADSRERGVRQHTQRW